METSIPLKDAWSLQMGVTIDPEQQSRANGAGDVNGRVGFGFKFWVFDKVVWVDFGVNR